jgi:hypothetical protein
MKRKRRENAAITDAVQDAVDLLLELGLRFGLTGDNIAL